jgi:NAD(P)-dependent dehydrogenase (short-subunit alcohol dehydrogenase family)
VPESQAEGSMYRELFNLDGQVIVVTGGAGHLGREISLSLAEFGAHVIALGRTPVQFPDAVQDKVEFVSCDVQDEAAFVAVIDQAHRKHGRLDGLVNNANAAKRETWDELSAETWRGGLDATLTHYFTCTKTVSKLMLKAGRGAILNISSIFGFVAPNPAMYPEGIRGPSAHHCAAKSAILQMTRALAAEWAPRGIRVNAMSPGWFPRKRGPERPDFMREVTSRIPMARIGQPREVAGTAVFLMSEAASYVTGQNVVVDGGYSIW